MIRDSWLTVRYSVAYGSLRVVHGARGLFCVLIEEGGVGLLQGALLGEEFLYFLQGKFWAEVDGFDVEHGGLSFLSGVLFFPQ